MARIITAASMTYLLKHASTNNASLVHIAVQAKRGIKKAARRPKSDKSGVAFRNRLSAETPFTSHCHSDRLSTRMSTIDLTRVDEHILKQIVKKFSARSGARFYRSCRGAKELVEFVKPVWPLQSSRLTYFMNKREASKKSSVPGRQKRLKSATVSPPFCKLEEVAVRSCNTDYLQAVILPEVRALGAVGTLEFGLVHGPHIPLLLEAAKPDAISLCHSNHDVRADVYKSVKNLYIDDSMYMDKIYWTTKILFELAQGRDSITLHTCSTSLKKTPISFLKAWLKGESTGTLKQLTVSAHIKTDRPSDEKKAFQRVIAKIVKNKNSTRESYNVERGRDLLHICVSGLRLLKVDFYFS